MMNRFLLAIALTVASIASHAGTLTQLQFPAGNPARAFCLASGFDADHTISGACQSTVSLPCSGRSCQPVKYITNYVSTWNADGSPLNVIQCSVTRRHYPQSDQVTYTVGYDASSCPGPKYDPHGTVVVIDGVPYYYIDTDPVTGAELVASNVASYLYQP